MAYEPNAKIRFYQVKCWQPATGERKYGSHWDFGVVARSAPEAIATVASKHPDCRIDAVNERGVCHHVAHSPESERAEP